MGGDDAAGLLEIAELEGDGRADDDVRPIIGDREATHPFSPVVRRARRERAAGSGRSAGNGSSGPSTRWSGRVSTKGASRSI
jgi:hypothetical protein